MTLTDSRPRGNHLIAFLILFLFSTFAITACGGGGGSGSGGTTDNGTGLDPKLIGSWAWSGDGSNVIITIDSAFNYSESLSAPTYSCSDIGTQNGSRSQINVHSTSTNCPFTCTDASYTYTVTSSQLHYWGTNCGSSADYTFTRI